MIVPIRAGAGASRFDVGQLRSKIDDDPGIPTYNMTESHIGYRFSESVR